MSQAISIVNKPKICSDVSWRWDGEDNQIIVLSKESLALPLILNITAAKIFTLCNGKNSIEDIAKLICEEFSSQNFNVGRDPAMAGGLDDYEMVLKDVEGQIENFIGREIIEV